MPTKPTKSSPAAISAALAGIEAAVIGQPTLARPHVVTAPVAGKKITTTIDLSPVQYSEWDRLLADLSAQAGRRVTRREYVVATLSAEGRGVVARALGITGS